MTKVVASIIFELALAIYRTLTHTRVVCVCYLHIIIQVFTLFTDIIRMQRRTYGQYVEHGIILWAVRDFYDGRFDCPRVI